MQHSIDIFTKNQVRRGTEQRVPSLSENIFQNFIWHLGIIFFIITLFNLPSYAFIVNAQFQLQSQGISQNINTIGSVWPLKKILQTEIKNDTSKQKSQSFFQYQAYFGMNITIKCMLMLYIFVLQYRTQTYKQKYRNRYIENFTLQVKNLPEIPAYSLIPQLKLFLQELILTKYRALTDQVEIFDIERSLSQKELSYQILLTHLNYAKKNAQFLRITGQQDKQKECKVLISDLKDRIKELRLYKKQKIQPHPKIVWVTFMTHRDKHLMERISLNQKVEFLGQQLIITPAPHPAEIKWANVYYPKNKKRFFRILGFSLATIALIIFDIIILQFQFSRINPIITSLAILALQIILKIVIVFFSSLERQTLESRSEMSKMRKLAMLFYINTGLIIVISRFNFGSLFVSDVISTNQFSRNTSEWFEQIIPLLTWVFIFQLIYANIRIYLDCFKSAIFGFIGKRLCIQKQLSLKSYIRNYQKQQTDLAYSYAHVVSIYMIGITYSLYYPLVYPYLVLFSAAIWGSHRTFIKHVSQPCSYNNQRLNKKATELICFSIIIHFLFLTLLEEEKSHRIVSGVFFGLSILAYFIRWYFLKWFLRLLRAIIGGVLIDNLLVQELEDKTELTQLLNFFHIRQKRNELLKRKKEMQLHIDSIAIEAIKNQMMKYQQYLSERIDILDSIEQNEFQKNKLLGKISYSFTSGDQYQKVLKELKDDIGSNSESGSMFEASINSEVFD